MTETEWLACTDPPSMLKFLQQPETVEVIGNSRQQRKERLFGCACCRQVENLLGDPQCLQALQVAERLADDAANADEQEEFFWLTHELAEQYGDAQGEDWPAFLTARILNCLFEEGGEIAHWTYQYLIDLTPWQERLDRTKWATQAIHCIWGGLPFRAGMFDLPRAAAPVTSLAEAVYTDRAFDRLPILADALEDAGCTQADILEHCRGLGPHVRGCWVVDLLLGKE